MYAMDVASRTGSVTMSVCGVLRNSGFGWFAQFMFGEHRPTFYFVGLFLAIGGAISHAVMSVKLS